MWLERLALAVPIIGMIAVAAWPIRTYYRMESAAGPAAETLLAIRQAQETFRSHSGGYASALPHLLDACPGQPTAALTSDWRQAVPAGYTFTLRPTQTAAAAGKSCHGIGVTDYVVTAAPRRAGVDGRHAMAMTSAGRICVFFDGLAPREDDLAPGGLAVPLDALASFIGLVQDPVEFR